MATTPTGTSTTSESITTSTRTIKPPSAAHGNETGRKPLKQVSPIGRAVTTARYAAHLAFLLGRWFRRCRPRSLTSFVSEHERRGTIAGHQSGDRMRSAKRSGPHFRLTGAFHSFPHKFYSE